MAATLRFHKEFYSPDALTEAVADWTEVGSFAVNAADDSASHHLVTVDSLSEGDLDSPNGAEVLGEFVNYVLGVEFGTRRK
jgi:hypothetical protein